jgi:hypothetical protein
MKHFITGYKSSEDTLVFKQEIPLILADLKSIMGWQEDDQCAHDHKLNDQQVSVIESMGALNLPKDLELYLTCES